ncbi:polysaccharide ABC transporter ATP-binding protein [Actinocatenispora thailandica]|uniref:Polysaccharide ABC transporter ATP-binding protein n=1 Tax=Actinocatenispora thailandica TaxID=227318 RepID=A0A7R7HYR0_9ACTN|nr:ABC transporter permease subunit [Actinocatenispora thailandica]BCJ36338.1 polysaccharide ABC transporter ATP-binding protein [Actinocatenispora thailandica]
MTASARADEATPAAATRTATRRRRGAARGRRVPLRARLRKDRTLLFLCLPGLLYFVLFYYLPLAGNVIAFQDYQPFLGFGGSQFVGLANFTELLSDADFWSAVRNTLEITVLQLVLYFPAPIGLALLLNSMLGSRIKRFVQTVVYLPHFLSWVVVVAMFGQVLGGAGSITTLLRDHGVDIGNVMANPDTFKLLVTSQVIWKDTGWATIIFLAAMTAIDLDLYESAACDGAGRWRRMWHITLPGIRAVTLMLLILRLGDILSVGFEQLILQRDAVGAGTSEVIDTFVYYHGVIGGDWGMSTAAGLMKGVIGVALIVAANKLAHHLGEQGVYQK